MTAGVVSSGPIDGEALALLDGLAVFGDDFPRSQAARSLVEALEPGRGDAPQAAFEILVRLGHYSPDENLLLRRHLVREVFPAAVTAEADLVLSAPSAPFRNPVRRDFGDLEALAVDDPETREVDDALSAEPLEDGGLRIWVHIADAAAYVPAGGEMEREAMARGATLYLPDRRVTMLPPAISEGVASLVGDGSPRATLTFLMDLDRTGKVTAFQPVLGILRRIWNLSYEEADDCLARDAGRGELAGVPAMLRSLHAMAVLLREERRRRGAILLEAPDVRVEVGAEGTVTVRPVDRASPSRRLVAEMMILAGHQAARFLRDHSIPALFRTQARPSRTLRLGGDPPGLADVHAALRVLRRAEVGVAPGPHAGLGLDPYVQVTSPLRRFVDLLLQRQIGAYLGGGRAGVLSRDELVQAAAVAESSCATLAEVERRWRQYWILKYLAGRRGEPLRAVVLAPKEGGGVFVELTDTCCQTVLDPGRPLAPGDEVWVRVKAARPREGVLEVEEA